MPAQHQKAAGNILLVILIGVALFAALIFTMTRGTRSDRNPKENAHIYAQQIVSYAEKVNNAVQAVMMQNNCRESQIRFDATGTATCRIFNTSGGGLTSNTPPEQTVDTTAATNAGSGIAGSYYYEGNACVQGVGTTDSCSATSAELIFFMPWVTQEVCAAINQIVLGSSSIPVNSGTEPDGTTFAGTFAGTYTINVSSPAQSACYEGASGYHFYSVLLSR